MELQKWNRKKERARQEGDPQQVHLACKELAEIHYRNENYDEALAEYKEMESISVALQSRMDVGRANRMIGEVYCEKGDFLNAIKHQMKHLAIAREENDKIEEQRALATLGRTHFLRAETLDESAPQLKSSALLDAKNYYSQSLTICEGLTDGDVGTKQRMEMKARLFLNLGLVFDCQCDYTNAEWNMKKAIHICSKFDLWEDSYRSYSALGALLQKQGLNKDALASYDMALAAAERLSTKVQMVCDILPLQAEVLLNLPDFRGARQALLKAHKLKSPNPSTRSEIERKLRIVAAMCETEDKLTELSPDDNMGRKRLYEDMGDMASEMNNFKLALTYYHLMLQCVHNLGDDSATLIEAYVSLAQTYKDDGQYTKAIEYFKKELLLEKQNPSEFCKTSMTIAELYSVVDNTSAMDESLRSARFTAEQSNDPKLIKYVLSCMKRIYNEADKSSESEMINAELEKYDNVESSDDEDQDISYKSYGSHICLDDLSDNEKSYASDKSKLTRTRSRPKSNIYKKNEKGETPLHLAAISGNANLALKLIEQGHAVNVRDNSGWTPLHEACNHGNTEVAEILIEKGAFVNDRGGPNCDGITPLLDAASNGSLDCIELLLGHKASPLMKTNNGETVLDCLAAWRARRMDEVGTDLDTMTRAQYETIYQKLLQISENAGVKVSSQSTRESHLRSKSNSSDFTAVRKYECERKMQKIGHKEISRRRLTSESEAANEYESAMKALRYRHKQDQSKPPSKLELDPGPALLPSETAEDWLEDDIKPPNKRRKTGQFIGEPQRRTSGNERLRTISPVETVETDHESDSSNDLVTAPSAPTPAAPSTSGGFSNKLKEMNASRRQQISLMSAGVTCEKFGRSNANQDSLKVSPQAPTVVCVKVQIEDKLILVPVQKDTGTVSWLAQEASSRYKSLEGVEPVIRLVTQDGASLVDSDPISLVLGMSGSVVGQVLSWKVPSMSLLYKESCSVLNIDPNSLLVTSLEASFGSGKVNLSDLYLSDAHLAAALKAVSHYHAIQSLDLSGNTFLVENIQELGNCLVKLPQLRCLNLCNADLTSESLASLVEKIIESKALPRLQSLDLGYNPLGDCLKPLSDLLGYLSALTTLKIPAVDLTSDYFRSYRSFSLDGLEVLDMNHNVIGTVGIIDLLGRLDPKIISKLFLSRTSDVTVREVGMYLQKNAPPFLTTLDLGYCYATELDVTELIDGVRKCPCLESLVLDGLPDLSSKTVETLTSLGLQNLSLCGIGVTQQLHVNMASLAITSCVEQSWGRRGPFGYVTTIRDTTTT